MKAGSKATDAPPLGIGAPWLSFCGLNPARRGRAEHGPEREQDGAVPMTAWARNESVTHNVAEQRREPPSKK